MDAPWQRERQEFEQGLKKRKAASSGDAFQYHPFDSATDAVLAQFLIEENVGKGVSDRLLTLLRSAIMRDHIKIKNVDDLRKKLSTFPGGVS